MSPPPSRGSALAVPCGFAEEEEGTGIHARPTLSVQPALSMPPTQPMPSGDVPTEPPIGPISRAVADLCAMDPDEEVLEVLPSDLLDEEVTEAEEDGTRTAVASDAACVMRALAPENEALDLLSSDDLVEDHPDAKADDAKASDDAARDARAVQASLPPPSPGPLSILSGGEPAWHGRELRARRPAKPFGRATIAGAAAALVAGVMLVSTAVDRPEPSAVTIATATHAPAPPAPADSTSASVTDPEAVASGASSPQTAMAAGVAFGPPAADPQTSVRRSATATPTPRPRPTLSLADGNRALGAGDLEAAEKAYQSILVRGGADHEALTGLGKIATARHRTTDAMAFFERSLALQPGYLPARLGLADALWEAGRKDAAAGHYREIRARFANELYPARVIERTR